MATIKDMRQSLLSRLLQHFTGLNQGAQPNDTTLPLASLQALGITPTIPTNDASTPLFVTQVDNSGTSSPTFAALGSIGNWKNAIADSVNDGTTVYTVTSGKTFYCFGYSLANAAGATKSLVVEIGSTVLIDNYLISGASIAVSGPIPIFSAASGSVIKVTGAGASANICMLWGVEV